MPLDLADDEKGALVELLRSILETLGLRSTLAMPNTRSAPKSRLAATLAKNRR
jgi:hypothetical protein